MRATLHKQRLRKVPQAPKQVRDFSASINRRSEDVRVLSVVIAELELGDIERHIFPAHFVECADHAALEDRPKAFNGLSVDCANDILASRMVNGGVWIILVERIVARILIGTKQADPNATPLRGRTR
jgi:hypothetical protein